MTFFGVMMVGWQRCNESRVAPAPNRYQFYLYPSDWPGLCFFCYFQPSCVPSQQIFLFHQLYWPPPPLPWLKSTFTVNSTFTPKFFVLSCELSANRVDLGFFVSKIVQFYFPPPPTGASCIREGIRYDYWEHLDHATTISGKMFNSWEVRGLAPHPVNFSFFCKCRNVYLFIKKGKRTIQKK